MGIFLAGIGIGVSLGLFVFGATGYISFSPGDDRSGSLASRPDISVGQPAPDFHLETLDGKTIRLSDMKGKPVLLNFWATWCPPCKEEMPQLKQAAEKYSKDMVVLGVNFEENSSQVSSYINQMGIGFPIVLDSVGDVANLYQVDAFPTTVLVDKNGVIQAIHIGQLMDGNLDGYLERVGLK